MNKKIYTFIACLIGGYGFLYAQLSERADRLTDTLSIGYGRCTTGAMRGIYSVSGVNEEAFDRSPSIDMGKALYGKIAGLNVYQGTGASPDNVASLSFHGNAPLVLIDGFPRDISDVNPKDIESCYLLKDAAATALYGVRGANGVLMINTKRGKNGKLNINVEYDFGVNTQFRAPEFANAYTYANALNTALENDGLPARYNPYELKAFRLGNHPYEFPDVNWWDHTMSDVGFTHNLNLSFSGGNERFRYFTAINYYRDISMLRNDGKDARFNIAPTDTRLNLRTNIDAQLTSITFLKANLTGKLKEVNETRFGRNAIFNQIYGTPSAAFPIYHQNGIYGGNSTYGDKNPVALLKDYGQRRNMWGTLQADVNLEQKLDAITKGLSAGVAVSFDNTGGLQEVSSKEYRYMDADAQLSPSDGTLMTAPVIYGLDSEVLGHDLPFERLLMSSDFQAKIAYDRLFGKHQVNGMAVFDMQSYIRNGRNASHKNMSYILNAVYMYDERYSVNAVFSRSGSAYLPDGNKFINYPAISAAWFISNERFMQNASWINLLKLRASYGLSGWDGRLSHELWRSSYISGGGYVFGENAAGVSGSTEGDLPVMGLTPEKSEKATLGIDFAAFSNRLSFAVDGFYEKRSNILVTGSNSVSGIIGINVGQMCAGIDRYKGFDFSLNWSDHIKDFTYSISVNGSYLDTEIVNNNQAFQEYDYLYQKGNRKGQMYGLEAIGFFANQVDINNSPRQMFSDVRPGDVKYKDQNGDHIIDSNDVVKMFGSNIPRFYFGFDLNLRYKGFEVYADFQGLAGKTVNLLNSPLYKAPLANNGNISKTFLNREICWTTDNRENATMPRLSTLANENNYRNSSLWYRDGSFLKLRNLIISYTFGKKQTRFADIKVFLQGNNLCSLDNLDFADPEQLGIGYPAVRSYWAGVKFNF